MHNGIPDRQEFKNMPYFQHRIFLLISASLERLLENVNVVSVLKMQLSLFFIFEIKIV